MSKSKKLTEGEEEGEEGGGGGEEEGEGKSILNYNYQQPLQAFLQFVCWRADSLQGIIFQVLVPRGGEVEYCTGTGEE